LNRIEGSSIGISKQPKIVFFAHYKVMGVFRLRTGRDKTNKGFLERRRLIVQS